MDDLGERTAVTAGNGLPGGHSLQDRQPLGLELRCRDGYVRGIVVLGKFLVGYESGEDHLVLEAEFIDESLHVVFCRTFAGHQQNGIKVPHGSDHDVQVLLV